MYEFNKNVQLKENSVSAITHMVQDAKAVAMNTHNAAAISRWRESNRAVSHRLKTYYTFNTRLSGMITG